ncbi:MAG TPA: hypothetical protein PLU22_10565, partial [Polyangiaceae bacterium]|nr:hypothetical protein [Polyangiaceae bacterium]
VFDRAGRGAAAALIGATVWFVTGTLLWLVPLIVASGGPAEYLAAMSHSPDAPAPFIDEAERRFDAGAPRDAVRALSTLIENDPGNSATARQVGYRMSSWGTSADAAGLLYRVLASRPFEPQSYRDLANVLGLERPALSTLLFESVLLGQYDGRFGLAVTVVGEEYALFARELARAEPAHPLNPLLAERMRVHSLATPTGDLRVTITWNTDATDIDLWVTDPLGERCYYADRELESGGTLLDDLTQGFGPERFAAETTIPGTYRVEVHYFGNNGNRLLAETYVNAIVVTHAGTDEERIDRYDVLLENVGDVVTVAEVTFP